LKIEISNGELVDKVTILSIKLEKIQSKEKLKNIQTEFDILEKSMAAVGINDTAPDFKALKQVNLKLWEIEDQIRIKESRQEFDDEFIELARAVYFNNDERAEIKRKINLATHSKLMEEKEYVEYK